MFLIGLAFLSGLTYQSRAFTVKQVLADVSKEARIELNAAPDVGEMRLVINVHDVSIDDLKEKIAQACSSKWVPYSGGSKLVLDNDLLKARQKAALEGLAKRIAAAQKKLVQDQAKEGPFTPTKAIGLLGTMERVDQETEGGHELEGDPSVAFKFKAPGSRASMAVIAQFDPYELAGLPEGTTVYSDKPTRLQRPLGSGIKQILSQLAADQQLWVAVFKGDPKFESRGRMTEDPRNYKEAIDPSKVRCLIKIEKANPTDIPRITSWFMDEESELVAFGELNLDAPAGTATPPTAPAVDPDVLVPADALEFRNAFGMGKAPVPLTADWRKVVTHPDDSEPLSFGTASMLISASDQEKVNLVASVPDDAFSVVQFAMDNEKPIKLARFWRRLVLVGMSGQKTDDWRVFWQPQPKPLVSRLALGQLMRSVDAMGSLRLDPFSSYAASVGGTQMTNITYNYLEALMPGISVSAWGSPWMDLRFYGSLSESEKKALVGQQPILLKNLNPAARNILVESVLRTNNSNLQLVDKNGQTRYGKGIWMKTEPTEILANGFDDSAQLIMNSYRGRAVLASTRPSNWGGRQMLRSMSINSLAFQTLIPTMPALKDYDQLQGGSLDSMIPGYQSDLNLRFQLRPDLVFTMRLQDLEFNFRDQGVTLEKLPQDYKDELAKAQDRTRKERGGGD